MDGRRVGLVPVEEMARLSGLEFLTRIVAGELPAPPMAATLGFALVAVERGRGAMAGHTGRSATHHYNPLGTVHGGLAMTLLDSCIGCAVQTVLAAGLGYTSVETKVNFTRAIGRDGGPLLAEGRIVSEGRRICTAEGRLVGAEDGRLYAHGTGTCLVFPIGGA
ncbi:PaaI family thioesterase [Stella sp.]|uniref:PaaI family thioesterase n=1 Tax=Stella sp. TaxID=2912054 RepID=UPI0035B161DD